MFFAATLLNICCILITLYAIVGDNTKKKVPLVSLRNIFLLGFLYFQSFGFFSWLYDRPSNGWWDFVIRDHQHYTSFTYGLMLNAFSDHFPDGLPEFSP